MGALLSIAVCIDCKGSWDDKDTRLWDNRHVICPFSHLKLPFAVALEYCDKSFEHAISIGLNGERTLEIDR